MVEMRRTLRVLCYEHHTEMKLSRILVPLGKKSEQTAVYVCRQPRCFVQYDNSRGYFIADKEGTQLEDELIPRVSCPQDKRLMYLAAIRREQRSYRLWRCPECDLSRTNEELSRATEA